MSRLARGLGWFSVGLGLVQIAAPRTLARMIGVRGNQRNRNVMLAIGARELAAGLGILAQRRPADWLWARVGYDVTDLALLGSTLSSKRRHRGRVAAATAAVAGLMILDTLAARQVSAGASAQTRRARMDHAEKVAKAITVECSPDEAYRFWRDLSNLPRFMASLESVQVRDDRRSHWTMKTPVGTILAWDAELIEDRPGEQIAWRSLEGAKIKTSGSVRFARAPGGRGTEVRLEIHHEPPGGALGAVVARLFGKGLGQHLASDLHRFKQVIETGDIVRSDASIHQGPHPARPPDDARSFATR